MKRKILFALPFALAFSITACNNNKTSDAEDKDTVVVEKNTTTTVETTTEKPSTSVTVDGNGAAVGTKSTDVSVSRDSITFKKK